MKYIIFCLTLLLCANSMANIDGNYRVNSTMVKRMAFYDLEAVQTDQGIWVLARVKIDDPKTYEPFRIISGNSGFLIKKGVLNVVQVLRGNINTKVIPFTVERAATKLGEGYLSIVAPVERYVDFEDEALVLCKISSSEEDYQIQSDIPVPADWQKYFLDFFLDKSPVDGNPLQKIASLKSVDWSDLAKNDLPLKLLAKSLSSEDYWEVSFASIVALEKTKRTQYSFVTDLLKNLIASKSVRNVNGLILSIDVTVSKIKTSGSPELRELSKELSAIICLLRASYDKDVFDENSLNIISNFCR